MNDHQSGSSDPTARNVNLAGTGADAVAEHYEKLLAPVYSWMIGDLPAAFARSRELLAGAGLGPGDGALAVDLGAGFGLPSIPLAQLGYEVVAIDSSATLLDELRRRAPPGAIIRTVRDDLRNFRAHAPRPCGAITCLGDTLTHLETPADIERLFDDVVAALAPGGRLVLGFRDYTKALEGTARFVPVRADRERILTCFLEYFPTHVQVHDVLHERNDTSSWDLRVSRYRKLRLAPAWVVGQLAARGLAVAERPRANGMLTIVAQRGGRPTQATAITTSR
jgi:SAM-dependent methyltransferase